MSILRQSFFFLILAFFNASASTALAKPLTYTLSDQEPVLRAGPGSEVAQNNCLSCHSGDYIETQPPKQGIKFWEAEVNKMIKNYHAPISETDAKIIIDYLSNQY